MRKVKMKILSSLRMEQGLNLTAMNIDPSKDGAEDATYQITDAVVGINDGNRGFNKLREALQRQHNLREGHQPSEELVKAIDKAMEREVTYELPEPLTRHQIFSVLRVPIPGALAMLGPMLEPRRTKPQLVSETDRSADESANVN